jgi:hypothetical protein
MYYVRFRRKERKMFKPEQYSVLDRIYSFGEVIL